MEIVFNNEKIDQIFQKGLSPNSFLYLLYCKENNKEYIEKFEQHNPDMVMSLIVSGNTTANNTLTEKGRLLIESIEGKVSKKIDINYVELHKKLQEELK